ncbi:MAG: hypothetical protein P1V97_00405 [Planctomycetota bacterium]|nr:hypothetical protein [Planctomycetota bacterium]
MSGITAFMVASLLERKSQKRCLLLLVMRLAKLFRAGLGFVFLLLGLCACHPKKLPKRGSIVLRSNLKPRRHPSLAPHGFARYSGDLRFIRRSMSTQQAHVPGRFETALRCYRNPAGQEVTIVATVHVAMGNYYQELEEKLADYPRVLYEDLKGSRDVLRRDGAIGTQHTEVSTKIRSQQELFRGLGVDSKKGWKRADLDIEELKPHLRAVGYESFPKKDSAGSSSGEDSHRVFFHLLGLTLVQNETGVAIKDELPRGLYRLGPQDFLEKRPWYMEKSDYALIYRRNDRVLEAVKMELSGGSKRLALLYGAAHSFDLQDRLFDLGFVLKSEDWMTAWALGDR